MLNKLILLILWSFTLLPVYGMEHENFLEEDNFPDSINTKQLKEIFGYKNGKSEQYQDIKRVQIRKSYCLFKGSQIDYDRIISHLARNENVSAGLFSESYGGCATTKASAEGPKFQGGICTYLLFLGDSPAQKPQRYELLYTTRNSDDLKTMDRSKLAIYLKRVGETEMLMCSAKDKASKQIESGSSETLPKKLSPPIYEQVVKKLKGDLGGQRPHKNDENSDTFAEDLDAFCSNAVIEWAFHHGIAESTNCTFQLSISQEIESQGRSKHEENIRNAQFIVGAITNKKLSKEALSVIIYAFPAIIDPVSLLDRLIVAVKSNKDNAGTIREFLINLNFAFTELPTGKKLLQPLRAQLEELDAEVALPSMFFSTSNFTPERMDKPISSPRQNPNNPFLRDFQTGSVAEPFRTATELLNSQGFFQEITPEDLAYAIKVRTIELYKEFTLSNIVAVARTSKTGCGELPEYSDGVKNMVKYIIRVSPPDEKKEKVNTLFKIGSQYLNDGDFHLALQFYAAIHALDAHEYISSNLWTAFSTPLTERQADVFRPQDNRPYLPKLHLITMKLNQIEERMSETSSELGLLGSWEPAAEFFRDYLSLKILNQNTPPYTNTKARDFVQTLTFFNDQIFAHFAQIKLGENIVILRRTSAGPEQNENASGNVPRKISSSKKSSKKSNEKYGEGRKFHKNKK